MTTPLAITGATGALGGRVARRLADRGIATHLIVRDPDRAPHLPGATVVQAEYGDPEAMRAALAGTGTMLLVSATETEDRVRRHLTAVDAAVAAGVGHIVYTSFTGAAPDATFLLARHHWHTEERLRASGVGYTLLRDNLYADVLPYFVGDDGVIRGPAGDGRAGFVSRDDIADAAVAVLRAPEEHRNHQYDLTGPASLTFAEVAEVLSAGSGRTVRYHPETVEEAYASRAVYDAPAWMVDGWVSTYTAIAAGELDLVTDDIARLIGRPATGLADTLRGDEAALVRLRGLAN